jgi:hypothetical protein
MSIQYVLTKEKFAKYSWCTCSRWQDTLISVVISYEMTYAIVVSVPVENMTNI